jgi:hypothetical protein
MGIIRTWTVGAVLLGLPLAGLAQEPAPPRPKNKVEEFVSRKGVLLVKKMYGIKTFTWDLGRDDKITLAVSAMHAYEADHRGQGIFALRLEGQPLLGVSTSALLDLASAQSLLSALDAMIAQGKENAGTTPEFLEVKFAVGDTFECGFNQQGTVQRPFIVLGADATRTLRSTRMTDLDDLRNAVAFDVEKLKELGAK